MASGLEADEKGAAAEDEGAWSLKSAIQVFLGATEVALSAAAKFRRTVAAGNSSFCQTAVAS